MKTIGGITLEKYAELCARMDEVIRARDKEACIRIAELHGFKRESWEKAHEGWQERITDPADMGKTASRFVPLWLAEVEKLKNSGNNNSPADPGSSSSPRSRKRKK